MKHLLIILFLLPLTCLAQFKISGRVINAADGKPIPDASVFINNTSVGAKAGSDGSFTLRNLNPGQYNLIVSAIGYERFSKTISVERDITMDDIKLLPKLMMMNEVVIAGKDPYRARKLAMFKEQFLGRALFWRQCTIVNPDILKLTFSDHQKILTASTNDFLEIENNALGYKLKYLINNFRLDKKAFNVVYEGYVLFEEKEGPAEEKVRWEKNRRKVYYGSPTHYLRTVLAGKVDSDYMVRPFCIDHIDTIAQRGSHLDPVTGEYPTFYIMLRYDTLKTKSYVHRTDKHGIYAISYPKDLDVFYYKPGVKHLRTNEGQEYGNRGQIGSIDFIDNNLLFDLNGTILNPTGASFRYNWAVTRVAELLPIDYRPPLRDIDPAKNH
ncbi:carboxypeptidase-like regulatory domain-containing protein [Mucilaginibacter sp. 14171R-50]|uniref:carboxypeptidase-like regulatory domain-containing protein n=1 Tax=Mucilaginibacter sp. 14171R-50 TaxID=2703789 RepID=UPI00138D1E0D|nr:carboxypeptidase-like regulatory domain-containing protein [Mucilaginibacter sp. 14171R-50]QHS55667.1 carboxypeptidase-like regulatory domain-containing protein [Mucilaginibacter sp. 14171R-50]